MSRFKKAQSQPTSVYFWVVLVFIAGFFVAMIKLQGADLAVNPNANLDNDSYEYIGKLYGVNFSQPSASESDLANYVSQDEASGNIKDFALEFFFTRSRASKIEGWIKTAYSLPTTILQILGIPLGNYQWLINLLNGLIWASIFIAVVTFIRRGA